MDGGVTLGGGMDDGMPYYPNMNIEIGDSVLLSDLNDTRSVILLDGIEQKRDGGYTY